MISWKSIVVGLTILFTLVSVSATEPTGENPPQMVTGAPAQMKEIAYLEGNWDVDMQWQNMEDTTKWDNSKGICTYRYILDGCAMECLLTSDMSGIPVSGYMLTSYDREKSEWQSIWIDNMGSRMSFYTGNKNDGNMILIGEEMWQGQKYLSRTVIFNETPTSFEWTMDNSYDGGKTWQTIEKAKYTKSK